MTRPTIRDIVHFDRRLRADSEQTLEHLQRRDKTLNLNRQQPGHQLLLQYLDRLDGEAACHPSDRQITVLGSLIAAALGCTAMTGLLFSGGQGLANAPLLIALFVLLPLATCVLSAFGLLRLSLGRESAPPEFLTWRWLGTQQLQPLRQITLARPLLSLLALKITQTWAIWFSLSALLAFLSALAFNDIGFIWGTTFSTSDTQVLKFCQLLSLPWSDWLADARITQDIIANSRYHPSQDSLTTSDLTLLRSWWPFLLMCMATYALLPRLLLLLTIRTCYRHLTMRVFMGLSGAERTLARLQRPVIETQSAQRQPENQVATLLQDSPAEQLHSISAVVLNLNQSANADTWPEYARQLSVQPESPVINLGNRYEDDSQQLQRLAEESPEHIILLVRGWEPPMGELHDLLQILPENASFTIALAPLSDTRVSEDRQRDWNQFTSGLNFQQCHITPLLPAAAS